MLSKKSRPDQRRFFKKQVERLQRLGLMGKIDLRKKASAATIRQVERYKDLLVGKAAAVKTDKATAAALRKEFGLRGRGGTVVIPKEKREKFRVTAAGELKSTRPGYIEGETITKIVSKKFHAPKPGEKAYYTIPERTRGAGKLKRRTFSTFDEMLYYLSKYEINFEDIEDRIEVEYVEPAGRKGKRLAKKLNAERRAGIARARRKRKSSRRGMRRTRGK